MLEKNIQNLIRIALSSAGTLIFRNNVGTGWAGKFERGTGRPVFVGPQDVIVRNARPLDAGLCVGSSDLIGGTSVTITPEMVGQTVMVFTAVEVKTPTGRASPAQVAFIERVRLAGGRAGVARSGVEAVSIALGQPSP